MDNDMKLAEMKTGMLAALLIAEKLAWAYFCECPVGRERERAHDVYEKIRTATRA